MRKQILKLKDLQLSVTEISTFVSYYSKIKNRLYVYNLFYFVTEEVDMN